MIREGFSAVCAALPLALAVAQENPPAPAKPTQEQPAEKTTTTDKLQLDSTSITGNRELPKVLYIVPWKKSDLGAPTTPPSNSLLDEVLTPVDRDVFRRQTQYFQTMTGVGEPKQTPPATEPTTKPSQN